MNTLLHIAGRWAGWLSDTFRVFIALPLAMLLVVLVTLVAVAFIYLWRGRWIVLAAGLLALGVYTLDGFMLLGT